MRKESLLSSQFDDLATLYERFSEQPFRRALEFPSVLGALGDVRGMRVLDLGCGSGVYCRMLSRAGAEMTGLDEATGMIDYAVQQEQDEPLGTQYVRGFLPPELHGTFDAVLGVYVLPYATTYDALVELCRTAAEALSPGGRFVTLPVHPGFHRDPNYYTPYGFRLHAYEPEDAAPIVLNIWAGRHEATVTARYWTSATLEQALDVAGFESAQWLDHRVSDAGMAEFGPGYWQPYLNVPHAALLACQRKGKRP